MSIGWILALAGLAVAATFLSLYHFHKWQPWSEMKRDDGTLYQTRTCRDRACNRSQRRYV